MALPFHILTKPFSIKMNSNFHFIYFNYFMKLNYIVFTGNRIRNILFFFISQLQMYLIFLSIISFFIRITVVIDYLQPSTKVKNL